MKVTLDLTKLLNEGAITAAEHDRLARLGRADTGTLLVNVLVGFGVVAVTAGCLLLVPSPIVGGAGWVLMAAGLALSIRGPAGWTVMAAPAGWRTASVTGGASVRSRSSRRMASSSRPTPAAAGL